MEVEISIHAPREGGDSVAAIAGLDTTDFNPRPPRGGRLSLTEKALWKLKFQSTPPARGATWPPQIKLHSSMISIHAPREGGDHQLKALEYLYSISIHAPREGGDRWF